MPDESKRGSAADRSAVLVTAVFLAALWLLLSASLRRTGGTLAYTLDDTYVHMAIAKHFAARGVWGVTPFEYTNSSSAPFWTFLLSLATKAFGPAEILPLLLNLACGLGVIWALSRLQRQQDPGRSPGQRAGIGLAVTLLVPLPTLVVTGLEHTLQLLLTLLFAHLAATALAQDREGHGQPGGTERRGRGWGLWILIPLLALIRYESLFLVLPLCAAFAIQRRWSPAVAAGALAILPLGAYGAVGLAHGWHFLPNTILIKGNIPRGGPLQIAQMLVGLAALRKGAECPALLALAATGALLAVIQWRARRTGARAYDIHLLAIFISACALHLTLADVGWFYRYEAYLIGLGIVAVSQNAFAVLRRSAGDRGEGWSGPRRPLRWAVWAGMALCLLPLAYRGTRAMVESPLAAGNIHDQQYQMGLFLRDNYEGAPVAVNDIGAVNFLADLRCVDLGGLAQREADPRILVGGRYRVQPPLDLIRDKGARIAVLYPGWFFIPKSWIPCGSWTIRDNVVNGQSTVAFFAVDSTEAGDLTNRLSAFAPRLPTSVARAISP